MIESLPFSHELFLRDMQAWVWMRYPTRQLSATDVFYALQWAASGLCARDFTSAFDAYLAEHPDVFDRGCRLSRLQYEAKRVIADAKLTPPEKVRLFFLAAGDTVLYIRALATADAAFYRGGDAMRLYIKSEESKGDAAGV